MHKPSNASTGMMQHNGPRRHNVKQLCAIAIVVAASVVLMLHASNSGPVALSSSSSYVAVGALHVDDDPSVTTSPAPVVENTVGVVDRAALPQSSKPQKPWSSMWERRYMTQPDATLFTRDDGVQTLLTAARTREQLIDCQPLSVSSFLVAAQLMEPQAELCYVQHFFQPCAPHNDDNANYCGDATTASRSDHTLLLVPVLHMRLDTTRQQHTDRNHRRAKGGISKDPFVQDWMEDVVGPMEFSVVSELRIRPSSRRSNPSSGSKDALPLPVLFHRVSSGFTVYDRKAHTYIAFLPIALDRRAIAAIAAANNTNDNNNLLVQMSLNIKLQREAFWGVNEVFHKTMGRTNLYVVGKGTTVDVPHSLWRRWWQHVHGDGGRSSSSSSTCLVGLRTGAVAALVGWWYLPAGTQDGAATAAGGGGHNHNRLASLKGFPFQFGSIGSDALVRWGAPEPPPSAWMVTGDSQSRSIYWALRDAMQLQGGQRGGGGDVGELRRAQKIRTADDMVPAAGRNEQHHVMYRWDNYLTNLSSTIEALVASPPPGPVDAGPPVVVVGMGAHPASWGQYTFLQYASHMKRVAAVLRDAQHRHPTLRIVWYGAPAWPKPKPFDNFRITNSRLGLFNYLALHALHHHSDGVLRFCHLDFYGTTLPVLKWSKDGSHYDKSVVMPTVADNILSVRR